MQNGARSLNLYLAPMEGVIDAPMRETLSQFGGFDQMVTEFVRVTTRPLPPKVFYRYCPELLQKGRTSTGVPVFVQLLGSDPIAMGENANIAIELGAPGIDLNFGCPAKTVNRNDGGAVLLKDPERVFRVVDSVHKAVKGRKPVTAKVRLGFEHKNFVREIAHAAEQGGAERLTIHARTKMEGYRPPAHWEYIATMREVVENIEVVANGDIWSIDDYCRCREITGCKSFALGRPALANPVLAQQIRQVENEQSLSHLTFKDFINYYFLPFVNGAKNYKSESFALCRAKQWLRLLHKNWPESARLFEQVKTCKNYLEFADLLSFNTEDLCEKKPYLPHHRSVANQKNLRANAEF